MILFLLSSHSFVSFSLFSFKTVYSLKYLYIQYSSLGLQLFLLFIFSVSNLTYLYGFNEHLYTDDPQSRSISQIPPELQVQILNCFLNCFTVPQNKFFKIELTASASTLFLNPFSTELYFSSSVNGNATYSFASRWKFGQHFKLLLEYSITENYLFYLLNIS